MKYKTCWYALVGLLAPLCVYSMTSGQRELYGKLTKMSLVDFANAKNLSLPQLLNETFYQIIGYTPERMKANWPPYISRWHIPTGKGLRILNTTSMSQLKKSYTVIFRSSLLSSNYSKFTPDKFLEAVYNADSLSYVTSNLAKYGVSLPLLLNTTSLDLSFRDYVFDVYEELKKMSLTKILNNSESNYYKRFLPVELSSKSLREFFGDFFGELEKHRLKMLESIIEVDDFLTMSHMSWVLRTKVLTAVRNKTLEFKLLTATPLNDVITRFSINRSIISSLTVSGLARKCMRLSDDFPLFKIARHLTTSGLNFGTAAKFLGMELSNIGNYSVSQIFEKIGAEFSRRQHAVAGPLAYIAFKRNISMNELSSMNLTTIVVMLTNVSYEIHRLFPIISQQKWNTTLDELAMDGFSKNALSAAMFPDIMKALSTANHSLVTAAAHRGLSYIASNISIGTIAKVYSINQAYLERLTLVTFVTHIAGVSNVEFAKIFNASRSEVIMLQRETFGDTKVIVQMTAARQDFNAYLPVQVFNLAKQLPSVMKRLYHTLVTVADFKNITTTNLSLSTIMSYGLWTELEIHKLISTLGMSSTHFASVRMIPLSTFSQLLNIPLTRLGNFSIIKLLQTVNTPGTNPATYSSAMRMTFHERAAYMKIPFNNVLNMTWFQIVGATPEKLAALGLMTTLSSPPSSALIQLLNTASVFQLTTSRAPIVSALGRLNNDYNYTLLSYFSAAVHADNSSLISTALKTLPIGNFSIARFLNTTESRLRNLKYLTGVYPMIKKHLVEIINQSAASYYEALPERRLPFKFYKELLGAQMFKAAELSRFRYAVSTIDLDGPAAISEARGLKIFLQNAWSRRYHAASVIFSKPLEYLKRTCNFQSEDFGNLTMTGVLYKCMAFSEDFPLKKFFPVVMRGADLMTDLKIGEMARFLNMKVDQFSKVSMFEVLLNLSADSANNTAYPVAYQAFRHQVKFSDMLNINILEFASRTKLIPSPEFISNSTISRKFHGATFSAVLHVLRQKIDPSLTVYSLYTIPYSSLINLYILRTKSTLKAALHNGLSYLYYHQTIDSIRIMYNIEHSFLSQQTLFTLANHISGINNTEFADLFSILPQKMSLLKKANIDDMRALLKMSKAKGEAGNFVPFGLTNFLLALPKSSTLLLDTVEDISKSLSIKLQDLTLSHVQRFLSLPIIELKNLFQAINVAESFFSDLKLVKLQTFSRIIHTPLQVLAKFNMIALFKSLCMHGSRFSGSSCIPFAGCKSASSPLCGANAECIDIIGSYICRCKAGYAGDGNTCQDDCQAKRCPSGSTCNNIPDKGAVCKCKKPLQVLKNGQCLDVEPNVFKVTGITFAQQYDEKYSVKSSKEYKAKAADFESALYEAICLKIRGCLTIQVTDIAKGSIRVDFNVIVDASALSVTLAVVQNISMHALRDPQLKILKAVASKQPAAQVSDICQSGHDCPLYSRCVLKSKGTYRCQCNRGYEMNGGTCAETDDKAIKIAVPVVVVGIVGIIIIIIIMFLYKHKRNKGLTGSSNKVDPM